MKILVAGDIHGHWCSFRDTVAELHRLVPLDLVLQCGDAQPFRNKADLEYMNCPPKYREVGDFWMFFEGEEAFPVPMLFIGGNHEPWNLLDEHRLGGVLAPNIEFLGRANVRDTAGLRIAGVSGVYSPKYFDVAHMASPYTVSRRKEATYFNKEDIARVSQRGNADILLLHEWPHLMNEARAASWPLQWGNVGSEHLSTVVDRIAPHWCFCGHMHFPAKHRSGPTQIVCLSDFHRNPADAIVILDTTQMVCEWPLRGRGGPAT